MIKTHKELADFIAGKKILHLNSLGKDSILCLEWLASYAVPSKIYSVWFSFMAAHPGDRLFGCDFMCRGALAYEGFGRALKFHKNGLVDKDYIYPLGLMRKVDIMSLIQRTGVRLHPSYKFSEGTFDHPSYWKMRHAFLAQPEYERTMMRIYPLLVLDKYRYEVLFK